MIPSWKPYSQEPREETDLNGNIIRIVYITIIFLMCPSIIIDPSILCLYDGS